MLDDVISRINQIKTEIATLDQKAGNANSEKELNEIGAQVVALESKLTPLKELLILAQDISNDLDKLKNKIVKL